MDPFRKDDTVGQGCSGYDGRSEMAQVTAIANESDKPSAFTAVVTRCQIFMLIMRVNGVNVLLG